MRHHFAMACASRSQAQRPHNAGRTKSALERRTFLTAERSYAGVRPRILPRAIVGGDDDDVLGASARMASMTLPMLESSSSMASE